MRVISRREYDESGSNIDKGGRIYVENTKRKVNDSQCKKLCDAQAMWCSAFV